MVVIGGAGQVGRQVVQDLVHHGGAEVVIADTDRAAARGLERQFEGRVWARQVDAGDPDALMEVLADASAAVGCLPEPGRWATQVAEAAIGSGVPYVDTCDDPSTVEATLTADDMAQAAEVTVLTGMGASPGLTGLMARQAYEDLYGADQVQIAWVADARELRGQGTMRQLLANLAGDRQGTPASGQGPGPRPRAGPSTVAFPEPLGSVAVAPCHHPESVTLVRSLEGLSDVEVLGALRPGVSQGVARAALSLGLGRSPGTLDLTARWVRGAGDLLALPGPSASGARVDAWAGRGEDTEHAAYGVVEAWPRLTGVATAIVAAWLAKGEVVKHGVHTPEQVLDPGKVFRALSGRGIVVHRIDRIEARPGRPR